MASLETTARASSNAKAVIMVVHSSSLTSSADRRDSRISRTAELFARLDGAAPHVREEILDEIILINRPVAESIAARYIGRGIAPEDLRQTALEGLVKAVHRFDPTRDRDLLSFAVPTIRGEVRRYFRDHGWSVRPPRRIQELQQRISRASEALGHELGREPAANEMAAELGVERSEFESAIEAYGCFQPTSLDQPQSREDGRTAGDFLPADQNEEAAAEARLTLEPVLRQLPERDRRILYLRFYEDRTQKEIGNDLGVTQMQISRLLTGIYSRLRDGIEHGPQALADEEKQPRPPVDCR